jgi:hypothetical protein
MSPIRPRFSRFCLSSLTSLRRRPCRRRRRLLLLLQEEQLRRHEFLGERIQEQLCTRPKTSQELTASQPAIAATRCRCLALPLSHAAGKEAQHAMRPGHTQLFPHLSL